MSGPEITLSEAVISQDERHRYSLTRRWGDGPRVCCWIMLNPSTADATTDDPTIRRCISFTHAWGYDALTVVNLYAWRATDPADLRNAARAGADVVGGLNDEHILAHTTHARTVIAAWGTHPATMPDRRDEHVLNLLRRRPIHCLGTNRDGSPKHPVRLRADTPRHLYRGPVMSQPNQYDADGWRYGVRFGGDDSIMHCWSGPTQRARAEEHIAAICAMRVARYGSDLTDQPHNALTLVRRTTTTSWEPAP